MILTLTQHEAWSDLRSGTILTVSEELRNSVSDYNPAVGQWWINVRANDGTNGTFITPSRFRTNNNNWQLRILDGAGRVVFGPAGEGVNPVSGVSSVEVFKLEEDPSKAITPQATYADGQSSSFGAPNVWNGGANMQDFSSLRSVVPYFPLASVRINEVLTHTDAPEEDWIELYNMTDEPVDIGGWYLTDDERNLTMFAIPGGTIIPASGFITINEAELNFALSASRGDEVYLSEADAAGMMTGGRDYISFGPAPNGVSFGRSPDGTGMLYPMIESTRQAPNAEPLVGPVVISEIMYQPTDTANAESTTNLEFIELANTLDEPVDLFTHFAGAGETHPWRIAEAVVFEFALGQQIPACSTLLVVGFDPTVDVSTAEEFRIAYELSADTLMVGPFVGRLNNLGEVVQLQEPDTPQGPDNPDAGLVPYVLVDEVPYLNRPPWPSAPAGNGPSLERVDLDAVGDVADNWGASIVALGTPGAGNSIMLTGSCIPANDGSGSTDNGGPEVPQNGSQNPLCGAMGMTSLMFMTGLLGAVRMTRRNPRFPGSPGSKACDD